MLCELTVAELDVGDGFSVDVGRLGVRFTFAVERVGVLHDHVEPEIFLDLFYHVRKLGGRDALDWRIFAREGEEEIDDALRDTRLFPLFVDVLVRREEK